MTFSQYCPSARMSKRKIEIPAHYTIDCWKVQYASWRIIRTNWMRWTQTGTAYPMSVGAKNARRVRWVQIRKYPEHPPTHTHTHTHPPHTHSRTLKIEKTGGRNPAPCFSRPLTACPGPKILCPAGHESVSNSENCDSVPNRWPRLMPGARQPPACPFVAGHSGADRQQRHFNYK